jgi:hypothetical protein
VTEIRDGRISQYRHPLQVGIAISTSLNLEASYDPDHGIVVNGAGQPSKAAVNFQN